MSNLMGHNVTIRNIVLFLILFGIEFDFDIGLFSLRKFVILIALLWIVCLGKFRLRYMRSDNVLFCVFMCVLSIYTFLTISLHGVNNLSIEGNVGLNILSIPMQMLWFFVFPLIVVCIFRDGREFLKIQLLILLIQSIVAILSRMNYSFRMFIYTNFSLDDGRMLEGVSTGVRVPIIGSIGASASVVLSIGCLICLYFIVTTDLKHSKKYYIFYAIICLAQMFVGRTGLYFSIFFFALFMIYSLNKKGVLLIRAIGIVFFMLLLVFFYLEFVPDTQLKRRTINWVGEILIRNSDTPSAIETILSMNIPPLTLETFFGTGIVNGMTESGVIINSDIGYMQTYASIGFLGAIIYYCVVYIYMLYERKCVKETVIRTFLLMLFVFIFIIEFKEPFLRKTPIVMIYVTVCFLGKQSNMVLEVEREKEYESSIRYTRGGY